MKIEAWQRICFEEDFNILNKDKTIYYEFKKSTPIFIWTKTSGKLWQRLRFMILERDQFKCQKCQSKDKLQIHHIIERKTNPKLFFNMNNMITMCKHCHKEFHPNMNLIRDD